MAQSSFKIDGVILRNVLSSLKGQNGSIIMKMSEDKIEFSSNRLYIKIPLEIIKDYQYDEIPILNAYNGFDYYTELPKKEGTILEIIIKPRGNSNSSTNPFIGYDFIVNFNNIVMTTLFYIRDILLLQPNIEQTNSTIILYDVVRFTKVLKSRTPYIYLGAIDSEIRIGHSTESYTSFIGEHRGEEIHTKMYNRQRIVLSKSGFIGADNIVIDIDKPNREIMFRWTINRVLFITIASYTDP